jgi:hypothetical protein
VNPFDEPNVQQAKDATKVLLERHSADGTLPVPEPDQALAGADLTLSKAAREALGPRNAETVLQLVHAGDYVAILAYLGPDPASAEAIAQFRLAVRERTHAATMFGYGPRYLHSTGQLHKGGPNTGVFVLISSRPAADLDVPGQPFSFGTLERAQALGDFNSLDATGRRAVHVHLVSPDPPRLRSTLDRLIASARHG